MPKKYVAYRHYNNFMYWCYERIELTEKELTPYIKKHLGELKNIEIYSFKDKVNIDLTIQLKKVMKRYKSYVSITNKKRKEKYK